MGWDGIENGLRFRYVTKNIQGQAITVKVFEEAEREEEVTAKPNAFLSTGMKDHILREDGNR